MVPTASVQSPSGGVTKTDDWYAAAIPSAHVAAWTPESDNRRGVPGRLLLGVGPVSGATLLIDGVPTGPTGASSDENGRTTRGDALALYGTQEKSVVAPDGASEKPPFAPDVAIVTGAASTSDPSVAMRRA